MAAVRGSVCGTLCSATSQQRPIRSSPRAAPAVESRAAAQQKVSRGESSRCWRQPTDLYSGASRGQGCRPRLLSPRAAEVAAQEPPLQAEPQAPSFKRLKQFLEEAKCVGRVRIIVTTGMGVLESVTDMEGLFYKRLPGKGEYANLIKGADNVDFHLLLDKVDEIHLVEGKSMRGGFPTFTMRFFDAQKANGASIFVMWVPGTDGQYDPGQVEGFKSLVEKYGKLIKFSYEGSEEASRL